MANGVLYTVTSLGQVAALDPGTGRGAVGLRSGQLEEPAAPATSASCIAAWPTGPTARRSGCSSATGDAYLLAIDAQTGSLDPAFGVAGKVDLMAGVSRGRRGATTFVSSLGADHLPRRRDRRRQRPRRPDAQGMAARRRHRLRRAHRPAAVDLPLDSASRASFGHDTWSGDCRRSTPAAPTCGRRCPPTRRSASSTCRSARRPTTSTAATGRAPTCSPKSLVARRRDAPARAAGTSRRCTTACGTTTCRRRRRWWTSRSTAAHPGRGAGEQAGLHLRPRSPHRPPVWPIEERPVPQSTAPGERSSPTQPFPSKPPAFERQGLTDDDLIDFTPELRQRAHRGGQAASNPGRCSRRRPSRARIQLPGWVGGANWGGARLRSRDRTPVRRRRSPRPTSCSWSSPTRCKRATSTAPRRADDVVPVDRRPAVGQAAVQPRHRARPPRTAPRLDDAGRRRPARPSAARASEAAAARDGDARQPAGDPDAALRRPRAAATSPALPPAGRSGERRRPLPPPETRKLYAFDKATGAVLWATAPPIAGPMAAPMTYRYEGRQYRRGRRRRRTLDRARGLRVATLSAASAGPNCGLQYW